MPAGDRSDEGPGGSPTRPRPSPARQVGEPRGAGAAKRAASGSSAGSGSSSGAGSRSGARPPRPPRPAETDFDLDPVDEAGLPVWLKQALATPFEAPADVSDTASPSAVARTVSARPAAARPAAPRPAAPRPAAARPAAAPPSPFEPDPIDLFASPASPAGARPSTPTRAPRTTSPSDDTIAGPLAPAIEVTETVIAPTVRASSRRDELDRVLAPTTAVPVVGVPSVLDDLMLTAALPRAAGAAVPTIEAAAPAAAPVTRTTIAARSRRPRVRKVRRVVRSVDAWSVFKVSLVFYALVYVVVLVAGVLLWNLAISTGTVANIEGLVKELFGLDKFTIDGAQLYRASWALGAFLAIGGTGLNVVAAVLFNLIADLVGGVRFTVLEEEVRADLAKRRRFRRAPAADSVDDGAPGSGIVSPP